MKLYMLLIEPEDYNDDPIVEFFDLPGDVLREMEKCSDLAIGCQLFVWEYDRYKASTLHVRFREIER